MLQNNPSAHFDLEVPYLKAQHVHWDGVRLSDLPTMWASQAEVNALLVKSGDLLVCEGGEVGRAAIVTNSPQERTIIQNALHLVRGRNGAEPRFLAYLLNHASDQGWFDVICNKSTIAHFTVEKFEEQWVYLPDEDQQRSIADYLDRQTARLDTLATEKERLLNLLVEKRQALITRAVTRGLSPNVPLRDSGIPWMGEIPAHWEVKRLKHISPHITVGVVVNPSSYLAPTGVPFLYGADITERGIRLDSARRVPHHVSREELAKTSLRTGDLVTVRVGAPGLTAVVPPQLDGANCASIMLTRGDASFNSNWLAYAMNSSVGKHQIALVQYGAAQEQFNVAHAVDFLFAVPPLAEQCDIVSHIDKTVGFVDALHAATTETITLLKERRIALITSAVTGQFDMKEKA